MTLPENSGVDEAIEHEKQKFLEDLKTLVGDKSRVKTT
jgi:hypothetical protein